jgi:hypothetical protein
MLRNPTAVVPSTVSVLSAPLMVLLVSVCVPVRVAKLVGNVFVPEVKSLFVTVFVLVSVRTLVGVMMLDRFAMCYSGCVGHLPASQVDLKSCILLGRKQSHRLHVKCSTMFSHAKHIAFFRSPSSLLMNG